MNAIRLGTVFGNRLNLDGDQGNLLALKRYLEAAGFAVEVASVNTTEAALTANFVLLGHGSAAAMASIDGQLGAMEWQRIISQVPGMAVGSGFEWLAAGAVLNRSITRGVRRSEFRVGELGPLRILGYRNSDGDLPDVTLESQFICTMLHGPILAKNPQLLHRAAVAAVKSAGGTWPSVAPTELNGWVQQLNRICSQIWALEAETPMAPLDF